MGECPLCGESTSKPSTRLIKESCGHSKCRLCLLNEESGCSVCEGGRGDISLSTIESIGNFDYRLPATTIPNYEELDTSPRKLDFNKIPDVFNDCHLDVERLTLDSSMAQDLNNEAKAPGPQKVDISTETEDIVEEEEEEEEVPPQPPLSVQQNTHSSLPPQVTQPSSQPVQTPQPKIPEVFANTVRNNHIAHQETPIVQNTVQNTVQNSFIPVTQRADGRQFITIAFIANNSPNKNQHVVTTPILNQCLPTIGNMATVQRPGGNQCIPVLGNLNALQNPAGGQFIIRNSNIVQNLMGNQSIPIIGNMNAIQNMTAPPSLTMMGNVNAAKNIAANQPLPSFATVNALQSQAKGHSFTTTGNPNVVQNVNALQSQTKVQSFSTTGNPNPAQNVVGNQPYQATQAVPKVVENQPAPAQETANTPRKQTRTRGLPRIKTVKNVNIVQKSLPNQSDKVSSKVEKSPVKGRRQRKELPVYLVPRKPNEKAKNVPAQSPTHLIGCMSPEYKLEDYLLFNNQQKINNAVTVVREMQTETKVTNHTQVLNKPSESVINESPIVSDQYNCTVMKEQIVENKVYVSEQQGQVPNDVSQDEKNHEGLGTKTAEFNENQDLNVIFNIRDENKQTVNEEIVDEREKLKVPNGETSSKEEYQNLDALFDIIEKESKKLNGGIFDKDAKHDLIEGKHADMPDLDENVDNGDDGNSLLDQTIGTELNHQNKEIETLNNEIFDSKETSGNLPEMNHEQVQSVIEEFPVENIAMQSLDKEAGNQVEKQNVPSTEMECDEQETETLQETKEYQNLNGEVLGDAADNPCTNDEIDDKETSQTLNEEVDSRKEDPNVNGELCQKVVNQCIEEEKDDNQNIEEEKVKNHCIEVEKEENHCNEREISSKENKIHNENESNDDKVECVTNNIDNKEKIHQTLYEDISDVENDSGESNNENPELQATSGESNDGEISCQCSDENSVEEESPILNNEVDDQEEESNQNEMIEAHLDALVENASSPSDVNDESSPAFKTNDPQSDELDAAHQNEQSDVMEKPRESPENSLPDEQPADVENKFELSLPTFKRPDESNQENDLSEQYSDMHVDNEEDENPSETTYREESQMLETEVDDDDKDQTHEGEEDESLHTSLTLTETQKSADKIPDSVAEDALPIVKKRGRKKKSFSDYELDCKPKASSKNQQPGEKKPRGRPKKSLSNLERPNDQQLNSSREIMKSTLPGEDGDESEVRNESVIHDADDESSVRSRSATTKNDEITEPAIVKKPRGRPKTKNVLPTVAPTAKVPHGKEQPIVKKPRGRPKKSLSNLEQSDVASEADLSIATESSVFTEKTSEEVMGDEPQLDERNERVPETDDFGQDSRVDIEQEEQKSLHSTVVVKKHRGRPKKSLSNCESQIQAKVHAEVHAASAVVVKRPRGRPKKSLSSVEQPPERDPSQEEQPIERDISQETEHSVATEIGDEEDKGQHSEDEENQILNKEVFDQDETSQNSSVDMDYEQQENLHSKVDEGVTVAESNELKPDTAYESEQVVKNPRGRPKKSLSNCESQIQAEVHAENAVVVKKPRGRPKKSLSSVEQPPERDPSQEKEQSIEHEISQETEHSVASETADTESQDQHYDERSEDEESQVLDQDETSQHSSVAANDEERESVHSETTTDFVLADKVDSEAGEESNAADEQPVVVKKPRGRPRKSLSSCDRENEAMVNDTNVQPEVEMNDEERESLHSSVNNDATVADYNDSDTGKQSNAVSDNEQPIIVKKPRGKSRKSLSSCDRKSESTVDDINMLPEIEIYDEQQEILHSNVNAEATVADSDSGKKSSTAIDNEQPIVAKKPRGRPKKSLSSCDRENVIMGVQPDVEMNDEEQESLHSNATFNNDSDAGIKSNTVSDIEHPTTVKKPRGRPRKSLSSCDRESESNKVDDTNVQPEVEIDDDTAVADYNDSNTGKKSNIVLENEQPIIVKKPRGRPKKSLSTCEIPSQLEVHDANAAVKKQRGRPKKSLSNLEQPNVPSEAEISVATEPSVLGEKTNDEEDEGQHSADEENEVLDQDETSQIPSVAANDEERESLHSEAITSLTFTDKIVSEVGEKSSTADEHVIVAKKPRGRPKKSLSNCEQQNLPETHNENAVVVKKSRGRPKKSLSDLEQPTGRDASQEKVQPTASKVSELLNEHNDEENRTQYLNGTIDGEESQTGGNEVGDLDDTLETSNLSMHTEQDETLDSEAEVNEPCNKNSVDDELNTTRESEQLVKKGRGRPKKTDVKKPRGRPKKSSYEQHTDKGIQEKVSQKVNKEEKREGLHSYDAEDRNEENDNQERPNEDVSSEVVSTLSQESVEVPKDEEESPISQEEESQDLKVQDDENKENKEKYSEKDDAKVEHETSATEQDLEKTPKADVEATNNSTTGRKYKNFDRINTQVIVENGKRKRKPKVLLYENEDLDISTSKKRKKDASTLPRKNGSRKSFEKAQVESPINVNESPSVSEQVVKSTEPKLKKPILKNPVLEIAPPDTVEKLEEPVKNESLPPADENSMDTVNSDLSTTVSSHNDDEKSSIKRHRRPKVLLYENEDLTITPKCIKKKKVEFQLPTNENSMDSSHVEADGTTDLISTEDNELPTIAKKSERVRKPKTLLYENERLTATLSRKRHLKFQLTKEDLTLLKRFNIKLQPIIVLDRLTDLSLITSSRKSKTRRPRKDPSVLANKIRGQPKKTSFSHIKKLSNDPPLYECKVCKESFRTYSIRKFHAACAVKTFQCQYCPRKFHQDTHRLYHERGHTGEKPFGCDLCGRRFVMKYKLNRHMAIHKCMPDLECNECGRKFTSKENLKSHLISHVKSSFVFACNHCPKSFNLDSNRKRHELSHSPVALFKCLRCPKSFKTKYEVARHVKTHQKLRPFACHDCGKTFLTKFEVRRHAVMHSDQKEYTCNYCEQQFGRYDNYCRHMRHHHPEEDPMSVRPPVSTNGMTTEADASSSSSEEKRHQRKKDQSRVKPKKISRSASNSAPMPISFSQTLTPQPAPAPYSILQNHDLASVIRETLPDLNNVVPVVSVQPSSSLMDPIPLEQALVLNRQIEEKIYTQSSFCEFPGLTRRNVTGVNRRQSYTFDRRSSSGSNSNSNDGTSFLTMNQERYFQQQDEEKMNATRKDIHVHWRRRTAETLKSKMDQNN